MTGQPLDALVHPEDVEDAFPGGVDGLDQDTVLAHIPYLEDVVGSSAEIRTIHVEVYGGDGHGNQFSAAHEIVVIVLAPEVLGGAIHGATGEHAIVGVELHPVDWGRVFVVGADHLLGVSHVPQLGGAVLAAADEVVAVRGDVNGVDLLGVVLEHADIVLGADIPQLDMGVIAATSDAVVLVGEEPKAVDGGGVTLQRAGRGVLGGEDVPDVDDAAVGAGEDTGLVPADGDCGDFGCDIARGVGHEVLRERWVTISSSSAANS